MHVWKKRLALGVALGMSLSLLPPASAASYADLDYSHWAYSSMDRARQLGILQGVGGNKMDPSGTLNWGQFLTLLSRTAAHTQYEANARQYAWDVAGYMTALETGLLRPEDGLPADPNRLSDTISRQDAAILLANALPDEEEEEAEDSFDWWLGFDQPQTAKEPEEAFSDWEEMDQLHQEAVAKLYRMGIVSGKSDGSFGCADTIQRADGTVLLMRVLEELDGAQYGDEVSLTVHLVDQSGNRLAPDLTVTGSIGSYFTSYHVEDDLPDDYTTADYVSLPFSIASTDTTVVCRPKTEFERQESAFWDLVEQGLASEEDYWKQDFWLIAQGGNSRKHELLFDDASKSRFANRQEAEANMVTITVPVWRLSNGKKVSGNASFSIHADIAEDVKEIFTEIYNDPEQFPICDVGGYSWRGDTATGEHNCGTAIDLNSNQNYQVRDGVAMVGSHWTPGSDPYSISPSGSVVRIFAEHGWSWGGDAWADSSDASTGYHDYMPFSSMGG